MLRKRTTPTAKSEPFTLVLCLERFWPAQGGVERYAQEIARWFRDVCPVVVIVAVRQNCSLRQELLDRRGSFVEPSVGPAGARVFTVGLGSTAQAWYRGITFLEGFAHRIAGAQYYRTRWIVIQETARLLARDLSRIIDVKPDENVVLHAMGPWEISHVGDRLFPNAARVATPFIHPGHWGEDHFSRSWFHSRDSLVALGEEDARACREIGISPDRIAVVPIFGTAVDDEVVARRDRRAVVFLGIARPYKGLDIFLDAVKILRSEGEDLEFIWAGSVPPETEYLITPARVAGVQVRGPVSECEKADILRRALCICLPSATEITPYSVLEAWAAGAPVVVTDDRYLREFVGEGGEFAGRDPGAFAVAIRKLAQQPELAERRAQAGRSYLRWRHHPPIVGSRLVEVYRQALARRDGRRGCLS
jgi:glycosyltransferase involved in cell wall biosynthesis